MFVSGSDVAIELMSTLASVNPVGVTKLNARVKLHGPLSPLSEQIT
jgi:hypothetical protein